MSTVSPGASGRSARAIVLPALAALAGLLVTLAIFYPGVLSRDGVGMYDQVVSGHRNDAKPRLFVDLWSLTDALVCGSGGIFAMHVALHWGAVLALATAIASNALARVAIVLGLGFLPPVFGRLPMVSTDNAVLAAWALAVGVLLHRDLRATAGTRRRVLSIAAFALLAYGALVRHNAITGVLPLLWLLVAPLEAERGRVWRRRWAPAVGLALLLWLAGQAINRTAERTYNWAVSPLWDLTAISLRSGELVVPRFLIRDPSVGDELRNLGRYYQAWSAANLFYEDGGYLGFPTDAEEARSLMSAWRAAIVAHPREYLWHRANVIARLLFIVDGPVDILFLEDPPRSEAMGRCEAPWRTRFEPSSATRAIRAALWKVVWTPVYSTWVWSLACIATVIGGARVGGVRGRFTSAIAVSGLFYVVPVAFAAPAAHFRYTMWLHAATAIAIVLLASAVVERSRERRRASETRRSSGRG